MLSFQEMKEKTAVSGKAIMECLDQGFYHPDGDPRKETSASIYDGLKAADAYELKQTLDKLSLEEVLMKTHTGQGTAYLVAAKVHDELVYAAQETDICPLIGRMAYQWEGADLTVNIQKHRMYVPHAFNSTSKIPEETGDYVKATLTPVGYAINAAIGADLIEDQQYGIVQWHVQQAGKAIGEQASELALTVMKTANDGDGTLNINGVTGDADETKWTGGGAQDIEKCITALEDDRWIANTMVTTTEAWHHSIQTTYLTLASNIPMPHRLPEPAPGFDLKVGIPPLDVKFSVNKALHLWNTDLDTGGMTNCVTFVFDRNNALLTGRKRWLELKEYSDPVNDLANAVISYRQDSVTLYNDSIAYLYET